MNQPRNRRSTDRPGDLQQTQHEQNRDSLSRIESDVRSIKERHEGTLESINEKLNLIFKKLDEAAKAVTDLALLEARVKTLEDARISTARAIWGLVTVAFGAVAEAFYRVFTK